jgi:hypothetical protein
VSSRFVRTRRVPKPRLALVLVSVFVAAGSLSLALASGGSATPAQAGPGFWLASSSGVVKAFGGAGQFGSLKTPGGGPVVGIAPTPDAGGYWLATAKGQVFGFGDAKVYGSMATRHLAKPIVGITGAPSGRGYWLFGGDGGVFSFGDARFLGSAGRGHLGSAVVAMAVAPAGHGYWLATKGGTVLGFGAVPVGPAKRAAPLGSAVAAMAATPDARGYWLVTAKGKVLAVGDAHNYGSLTGALKAAIVGIAPTARGKGYWLAARDGAVFGFGDAKHVTHQAQGPVSAIALSFNAGNPRARTAHVTSTTTTAITAAGTPAATGAAVGIGTAATPGAPTVPATSTTHSATSMAAATTTAAPTTTTGAAGAAGGNCTNPSWSTSQNTGTENLDPNGGEYWWVDNDAWSGGAGPQTLYVCNQSSWYAVSDQPNIGGQVETYPDTEYDVTGRGGPGITLGALSTDTSTFAESFPSAGTWDAGYDLWTDNWSNETMVWNQYAGAQSYWYDQGTPVTIGGVQYHFVDNGNCEPVRCSGAGPNNGDELMFIMSNQEASGTVDLGAIYSWEVANGYATNSAVLTQEEYGVEICATSGTETFPLTGLTFNVR